MCGITKNRPHDVCRIRRRPTCLFRAACRDMTGNCRRERESQLKVLFMAITRNPRFIVGQLTLTAKLASRRIHRLPGAVRFALLLLLLFFCILVHGSVIYWILGYRLTSDSFLEVDKCPACFGFALCSVTRSGNVWFTGWSRIRILDYFNVDNVYTGEYCSGSVHNYTLLRLNYRS